MPHRITLIPGDGIGPEVIAATRQLVDATGVKLEWEQQQAGAELFAKSGDPLPQETLDSIVRNRVALKGPTATPSAVGFRSVNVRLRQTLQLYANFRPARSIPGVRSRYEDVDLIIIRENTEGLYSGIEHTVVPGVVESLRIVTEKASERVLRYAFNIARQHERRRVTVVHKANILKMSDGLFLSVADRIARDYPQIEYDQCIVDAAAMKLVLDPHQFDVLVMENLFGDIISDLTSGLIGGLGLSPSANIGEAAAVFEAVHGSAPDLAGRGVANPTAVMLSAALMLRHLQEPDAASRIEQAVRHVIGQQRVVTRDLGGKASTQEFTDAVCARI